MRDIRIEIVASIAVISTGCGDDPRAKVVPWQDRTQVVAQADSVKTYKDCIDIEGWSCEEVADQCAGGGVDILVDANGKLLDSLCYPTAATWTVEDLRAHQGDIAQNENNTVLVLDAVDDGADITGDVSVDANNVVLYGESAATSVLDGSLTLDGNNALVRGIRITGDVSVPKNDVTLAFCIIEGSLTVTGNNVRLLGCDVLGAVNITGNGARLAGNGIGGTLSAGKNAVCAENHTVVDADADGVIESSEVGAPLGC